MKKLIILFMAILGIFFVGCSSSENSEPFIMGISDVANSSNNSNSDEGANSEIVENQDPFGVQSSQTIE